MRRKCRKCYWCKKVKTVAFHDTASGEFFCSRDCFRKAFYLRFLAGIECTRCGNPIRMDGVVQRRYTSADVFYCSEKCAMEDLGIIQDTDGGRTPMDVKIFLLAKPGVMCPMRHSSEAAGYDLYSPDEYVIPPRKRCTIGLGFHVELPYGCHMEIRPRSGLARDHGITVLNSPGTVDSDFRGEVCVILYNTDDAPFHVKRGDRIAQGVIVKHEDVTWVHSSYQSLCWTPRGENGFGSTER